MNAVPMDLAQLQRAIAAAVMQPLTPDATMRETAPNGRSMAAIAESLVAPNSRLSAFERLEIYNRQYWFRVLEGLGEDFPALRAVVGGRRFEALAVAYLTAHPSRSFTLRNLGSKLVDWLRENPGWCGRRQRLAVDVARVEWAFIEAFDSADRVPLTLDQIETLDADSKLSLQPHLRLMALDYPADGLVLALHEKQKRDASEAGRQHEEAADAASEAPVKLPRLHRRSTFLAAHRVDLSVYYRRLGREEYQTLAAIGHGLPLGAALEAGFEGTRIPEARRPHRVRRWFAAWAELGWICPPDLDFLIPA